MGNQFKLMPVTPEGIDPFQLIVDVGTVTFSTTDSQATYRTTLDAVLGGGGFMTGTTSLATDATEKDFVSVPLGAVSSGAITITRSSKGTSGAKFAILLWGHKYDTN